MRAYANCGTELPEDQLQPDHNGDPTRGHCLSSWAGRDDGAEWRGLAYAA